MSDLKSLMESRDKNMIDLIPKPEPRKFQTIGWTFEIKDRTFSLKQDQKSLRWVVIEEINLVYSKELHNHKTLGEAIHALSMVILEVEKNG